MRLLLVKAFPVPGFWSVSFRNGTVPFFYFYRYLPVKSETVLAVNRLHAEHSPGLFQTSCRLLTERRDKDGRNLTVTDHRVISDCDAGGWCFLPPLPVNYITV